MRPCHRTDMAEACRCYAVVCCWPDLVTASCLRGAARLGLRTDRRVALPWAAMRGRRVEVHRPDALPELAIDSMVLRDGRRPWCRIGEPTEWWRPTDLSVKLRDRRVLKSGGSK